MADKVEKRRWSVAPRVRIEPEPGEELTAEERDAEERDAEERDAEERNWWRLVGKPGLPFDIKIRVGRMPDGRLACTGLRLGDEEGEPKPEITVRALRALNLPDILKATADAIFASDPAFSQALLGYRLGDATAPKIIRSRPRPQKYDRAHFERIADLYREALLRDPGSPYAYLMQHEDKSLSTVRRWVQRARDKGLLGEAIPGKAGELPKA
jgi:hypothetical protein